MEHNHMLLPSLHDNAHQRQAKPLAPLYDQKQSALPSYPPPSYTPTHDLTAAAFPDVPTTELAPIQPPTTDKDLSRHKLPSLSSLTSPPPSSRLASPPSIVEQSYSPPTEANHWPSLNPLTAYYAPSHAQTDETPLRMDVDASSTATISAASPDRTYDGRASSVSLDDPDVRMAAEALGDLRADFVSSPQNRTTPLPASPGSTASQPEPLLSLLTTSHPLLAKTIEGTTSAYNTSKNFSPRFKSGAEYVENYLTPIGNTLGSVGRVTGVEGGVRWFLRGSRRHPTSADLESAEKGSNKRRKIDAGLNEKSMGLHPSDVDPYGFTKERRLSMSTVDTLPAYDDHMSPAYSEAVDGQIVQHPGARPGSSNSAWQSRLIMSTSGLSIAMSEESLRSLKYCLRWLRWANDHIGKVISALTSALDQFDKTNQTQGVTSGEKQGFGAVNPQYTQQPEDRNVIAARISALRGDVLKTLRDVIETVSKYAGGALPENAKDLVRRHLTSLPQRFRIAAQTETPQGETGQAAQDQQTREGAHKALVLAKEGLDMMAQVSGVLDGTIVSAEEWCERLGRKKKEEREQLTAGVTEPLTAVAIDQDVVMQ